MLPVSIYRNRYQHSAGSLSVGVVLHGEVTKALHRLVGRCVGSLCH